MHHPFNYTTVTFAGIIRSKRVRCTNKEWAPCLNDSDLLFTSKNLGFLQKTGYFGRYVVHLSHCLHQLRYRKFPCTSQSYPRSHSRNLLLHLLQQPGSYNWILLPGGNSPRRKFSPLVYPEFWGVRNYERAWNNSP